MNDGVPMRVELSLRRNQVRPAHLLPADLRQSSRYAGSLILAEVQRRLGVALQVARGGLRDGLALELLAAERAA
jgi:hypothetical protein